MSVARNGDKLKIRISQLSNGLHQYHFSTTPEELELGENFTGEVGVNVTLEKTGRQFVLNASVQASGEFQCDRCVVDFQMPVESKYTMVYVQDEKDTADIPPEEIQVLSPDTSTIDLTEDVRQIVLLSVPLKLLCRPECKGLCHHCGIDRNLGSCDCRDEAIDPRWSGLEGLLRK